MCGSSVDVSSGREVDDEDMPTRTHQGGSLALARARLVSHLCCTCVLVHATFVLSPVLRLCLTLCYARVAFVRDAVLQSCCVCVLLLVASVVAFVFCFVLRLSIILCCDYAHLMTRLCGAISGDTTLSCPRAVNGDVTIVLSVTAVTQLMASLVIKPCAQN
jgi:hypothetical protein